MADHIIKRNIKAIAGRLLIMTILAAAAVTAPLAGAFSPEVSEAASVPGFRAKKTDRNILRLARAYDRDAYHILRKQKAKKDKLRTWMRGGKSIVDKIDTCVHEEFHAYTFSYAKLKRGKVCLAFYVGNGKTRYVPVQKIFRTSKVMRKLPKKLRTFRYKTYVASGSVTAANKLGVFGLLNEFTAYYYGMHTMDSLYPYLKKRARNGNDWMPFVLSYIDNREAYAEFYFWTLRYLDHARKYNKKTYRRIMTNKIYIKVLYNIERKFRNVIKRYDKKIDHVFRKYNGRSFASSIRGGRFKLGKYYYPARKGYSVLRKEIASNKYRAVKRDIRRNML